MRKKIFVYSAVCMLCGAGILAGCSSKEPSKQETEEAQATEEASKDEKEEEVSVEESSGEKEASGNENVSGSAVSEREALQETEAEDTQSEENQKREEEFRKAVEETRKSYEKLQRSVDVASLEIEKGWEYAYFSPMLIYYEELAREGLESLTEEEASRAESGIFEVRQAIEEWK